MADPTVAGEEGKPGAAPLAAHGYMYKLLSLLSLATPGSARLSCGRSSPCREFRRPRSRTPLQITASPLNSASFGCEFSTGGLSTNPTLTPPIDYDVSAHLSPARSDVRTSGLMTVARGCGEAHFRRR